MVYQMDDLLAGMRDICLVDWTDKSMVILTADCLEYY